VREARECGLDIRLDALVNLYSYPGRAPVIVATPPRRSAASCAATRV
jgi:hypothetical protein